RPGGPKGVVDVCVTDRQTGAIQRVSVSASGSQAVVSRFGGFGSIAPALSADGRFVAYQSDAINLVPGDTNGGADNFVYDRQTGQVERVSVTSAGGQASVPPGTTLYSVGIGISDDGRTVAFDSEATNLVPDDHNFAADVFVHAPGGSGTHRVTVVPGQEVTGLDFGNRPEFTLDFGDAPASHGTA